MRQFLLAVAGATMLAASGAAYAQAPPPGGPDGGPDQHHERWGDRGGMMHRGHMHGDGSAFFRFRRGDAEMDIKCPAAENVQACVTAAGSLMDKVSGMQPKAQ